MRTSEQTPDEGEDQVELTPTAARQGWLGPDMAVVLVISTVLAAVCLSVFFVLTSAA